jgi:signal transduction histidine kinase
VDNALGHSHRGGEVLIRVSNVDGRVELSVVDHGDGFDPGDSTTLTKRFARGRDAPGQGRRFGLGLALVSEVVQAHGGTLRLDGRPGQGATATISLPVPSERPDVPPLPVLTDEAAHLVQGVAPPADGEVGVEGDRTVHIEQ